MDGSAIGEETLIYNLGKAVIGEKVVISHRVYVCAESNGYIATDIGVSFVGFLIEIDYLMQKFTS